MITDVVRTIDVFIFFRIRIEVPCGFQDFVAFQVCIIIILHVLVDLKQVINWCLFFLQQDLLLASQE